MNTNEPTTPSAIRSGEPLWCADCKSYHPIDLHTDMPGDAPTPETNEAAFGTGRVSVDFARRLERERDEARAELARLKANNRYQRGYHDGEQAAREELKTPTPPTEGSAVEWAQTKMITREDIDGDLFKCLQEDDAIELQCLGATSAAPTIAHPRRTYPPGAWDSCGATAMQSCRKSRRSPKRRDSGDHPANHGDAEP